MRTLAATCLLLFSFLALPTMPRASDELPGKPQESPILIEGGTIHPVSGPSFVGSLLFDKGRIAAIGKKLEAPADAEKIDAAGKHIFPGFLTPTPSLA